MKVAVIGSWAPSLIRFRGPLLHAIASRGHDVHALAPEGTHELSQQLAALGATFHEVALERAGLNPAKDLRSLTALALTLRRIRPQLVLAYTIKPIVYGIAAASMLAVPRRAALITGLGYAFGNRPGDRRAWIASRVATQLYRRALGACQTIFVQNPDDRRELVERGVLQPDAAVTIVRGSGVSLDEYPARPLAPSPVRFLFMGRLLRDKGIYEYVEAARAVRAMYPEVRFGVLGWLDANPACVARSELDAWVQAGTIEYLGASTDVHSHLEAAHVLVLPSYREGTPRSVLEAMSTRRAVITTDVVGCRETVVDGISGLLVPPRDPAAIAAAAKRLVRDRSLLERIAEGARARVELLYDARVVAAQMVETMGL